MMELEDIQHLLDKINGCTFAGLDTTTIVDLRGGKSNPYLGRVTKVCKGSRIMLFTNKKSSGYENMVKRRLEQEGKNPASFSVEAPRWGERIPDSPLFMHIKDGVLNHYIQTIFLHEPKSIEYFLDGTTPIAKDNIQGLPPEPEGSGKQDLDNEVIVRTYKLASIDAIRIFNEEIIDIEPEQIIVNALGISG
jgi:hypothetical protein